MPVELEEMLTGGAVNRPTLTPNAPSRSGKSAAQARSAGPVSRGGSARREVRLFQCPRQHSHDDRQAHPLLDIANLDQQVNMIGHDRKAGNRLNAIPRLMKGLDDVDEKPRRRIGLKIVTRHIANHPGKLGEAARALDRDHIEIRPRVVKTSQSNAHRISTPPCVFPIFTQSSRNDGLVKV